MKLSIVIPVYNKEVWLRPLFESLMGQGLDKEDYEIIFVNDGSTDGSDAVCRDLISAHPEVNVKYRTQANAGVSAARNAGIDMAAGEYIHFLDCDDYMLDGSYGYLLEKWGDEGLDYIGFWPIWLEMRNGVDPSAEAAGLTVSGDEKERVSGLRLVADGRWPSSSVAGLYRREFLKSRGVAFPVGVIVGEDLMFNSDFFIRSPRCVLTSCLPYVYRVHSSSTMNTISAEKAEKWFFSYYTTLKHLVDYKQNTPPAQSCISSEDLARGLGSTVSHHLGVFIPRALQFSLSSDSFRRWARKFVKAGIVPDASKGLSVRVANFVFLHPAAYPLLSWTCVNIFYRFLYHFVHK